MVNPLWGTRPWNYSFQPLQATPGYSPNVAGVSPALYEIISAGAGALPPGYTVSINEGFNNQGHMGHWAGEGTVRHWVSTSQHSVPGLGALDVQITDPNGKVIPNEGNDPTGMYQRLAQGAYGYTLQAHPELVGKLAWGGSFAAGRKDPRRDLMHFDLGGERGGLYPTLSRLGPLSPGAPPIKLPPAAIPKAPLETEAGPGGPPAAPAGPTLRRGMTDRMTGGAVSALQQRLQQAGYNLGRFGPLRSGVDGIYGPVTAAAVKKFQADQGLPQRDAVAGPQTQAALGNLPYPPASIQSVTPPAVSPMDYGLGNLPSPMFPAGAPAQAPGAPPAGGLTGVPAAGAQVASGAANLAAPPPGGPPPTSFGPGVGLGAPGSFPSGLGMPPQVPPPAGNDATKIPGMPTTIVTDPSQALPGGRAPLPSPGMLKKYPHSTDPTAFGPGISFPSGLGMPPTVPSPAARIRAGVAYGRAIGGLPTSAALTVMPLPRPRPTAQPDFAGAFTPGPSLTIERPTISAGAPTPPPAQGSGDSYPPNPTAGMDSGYGAGLNLAGQPPPGGPPSPDFATAFAQPPAGNPAIDALNARLAAGPMPTQPNDWQRFRQAIGDEVAPFGQAIGNVFGPGGAVFGASKWVRQQLGMDPTPASPSDNITNNLVQSIYGGGMTVPGGPGYSVMSQAPAAQPNVTPSWGMGGGGGGWGSLGSAPGGPGGYGMGGLGSGSNFADNLAAAYGFSQQDPRQQQQGYGYGGGYY
jgi:peptidoglycan hydrolase-like protein with peptidoglycan-binding domain